MWERVGSGFLLLAAGAALATAFMVGRSSVSCECPKVAPPLRLDSTLFVGYYLDPPRGKEVEPIRELEPSEPVRVVLAGCDEEPASLGEPATLPSTITPPAAPLAPVGEATPRHALSSLLSLKLSPGTLEVVRYDTSGPVVTEYEIPERGNRFHVVAGHGRPNVIGDRWWRLRDVEVTGAVSEEGEMWSALQIPLGERWSAVVGRSGGVWWLGGSVRPFSRWP